LENKTENGDVTGRTVVGIVSGGIGCGNNPDKKPNYPKWWARVSELKVTENKCLVLLQIPKCFVPAQTFWARPKIELHLVLH
jgi:hypothetical protein